MGREVKRVPVDFVWPEGKVWDGYMNPHYKHCHPCRDCNGTGETVSSQRLGDLVSLLMLSGEDAGRKECHPNMKQAPLFHTQGALCGQDMAELATGLAGREPSFVGHDPVDRWTAKKKIVAAAGLGDKWGTCPACQGTGEAWDTPESKKAADDWEPTEPPAGDGYQIWETVSEGSPISPVFATPEELAEHMAETRWGADRGTSYETWLRFICGPGWAPSLICDHDGVRSGVEAASDL